jgi:hypothetical protein
MQKISGVGFFQGIRKILIAVGFLVISGCYMPHNYEISMQIDPSGDYAFEYKGELTHLGFLQKIGRKEIDKQQTQDYIGVYERDLRRDVGFSTVEYMGNARYRVEYKRQGNIKKQRSFSYVRRQGWFMRFSMPEPGILELKGNKLPKRYIDELMSSGFNSRGFIRIWTKAKVGFHNATREQVIGGLTLYEWDVRSMRDPTPRMIIQLK